MDHFFHCQNTFIPPKAKMLFLKGTYTLQRPHLWYKLGCERFTINNDTVAD